MARVIAPGVTPPRWQETGAEVVTIALDSNEVDAIACAMVKYRQAVKKYPDTHPGSLNGAGARVFEALQQVRQRR